MHFVSPFPIKPARYLLPKHYYKKAGASCCNILSGQKCLSHQAPVPSWVEQLEDWGLSQPESCAAASGSTFTIGGDCAGNHNGSLGIKFKEKRC